MEREKCRTLDECTNLFCEFLHYEIDQTNIQVSWGRLYGVLLLSKMIKRLITASYCITLFRVHSSFMRNVKWLCFTFWKLKIKLIINQVYTLAVVLIHLVIDYRILSSVSHRGTTSGHHCQNEHAQHRHEYENWTLLLGKLCLQPQRRWKSQKCLSSWFVSKGKTRARYSLMKYTATFEFRSLRY